MPLTVTFDTNTLDKAARPERFPKDPHQSGYVKVHDALRTGGLKGYFSETLVTLEGIQKEDRVKVLGSMKLEWETYSTGKNTITYSVSPKQARKPLHPEFPRRIQAAQKIGMRALMAPRLLGDGVCAKDDDGRLFEPPGDLGQFVAKATHLRSEIGARGIGHASTKPMLVDGYTMRWKELNCG